MEFPAEDCIAVIPDDCRTDSLSGAQVAGLAAVGLHQRNISFFVPIPVGRSYGASAILQNGFPS
jgi:hypothetical protein